MTAWEMATCPCWVDCHIRDNMDGDTVEAGGETAHTMVLISSTTYPRPIFHVFRLLLLF